MASAALFDFIVIGGGINGLTAACYLAKAGFKTLLLEKKNAVGGGAITEEITLPGFKHDVLATSINIFKAGPIQQELELERFGYRELNPEPVAGTPFKGGSAIMIYKDPKLTYKTVERYSKKDAKALEDLYNFYLNSKDTLLSGLYGPPLPLGTLMTLLEESEEGREFIRLMLMSARDYLDENFESEEVKAFLALWACNHVPYAPEDSGSVPIILVFYGLLQEKGCGIPVGGIKTLADALALCFQAHGGIIAKNAEVTEIVVKDAAAKGVKLRNGQEIEAKRGILSNVEPKTLFFNLVGKEHLEPSFIKKVERFRYARVTEVMVHAALDAWLDYKPKDLQKAGIVQLGPSLRYISEAYNQCNNGIPPKRPFITIDNTTVYDPSRAPQGKHILWAFVRAPAKLARGEWSEVKERFADRAIDVISEYAPNIKNIILKRVVHSPEDIQNIAPNIILGDPCIGSATLDQSMALRPFPGWSNYRTPIKGLYMCSASTHPGGGVSGAPGHNAVKVILEDVKKGEI
ncbi:MAG: NAD(P)/FAD-dependent oxidoreductase [Nitrososphaerales archaeon]